MNQVSKSLLPKDTKSWLLIGVVITVVVGCFVWLLTGCTYHGLYPEDTEALLAARVLQEHAYYETDSGKERAENKVASCDVRSVFVRRKMMKEADAGGIACE